MPEADVHSVESQEEEAPFLSPVMSTLEQASAPVEGQQDNPLDSLRWQPMLELFGSGVAAQFLWAVTTDGIETYEHRETYRFLHIDSVTGECLNQQCQVISSESALQHALQPRVPAAAAIEEVAGVDPSESFDSLEDVAQPEAAALMPQSPVFVPQGDVFEPQINGFMRKLEVAEVAVPRITLAEPAYQPDTFMVQEEMLAPTRQSWLTKALRWSNPLSSKAQDGSGNQRYNTQELDFANFTRRPSVL